MNIITNAFHNKSSSSSSSSSFSINQTSKLYPFHGISKHLFDKFLIIGYNTITIFQELVHNKSKLLSQKIEPIIKNSPVNPFMNAYSFQIETEPMILSEICSDYEKILLDNDMILRLLFPNKPIGYYFTSDYVIKNPKKQDYPKPFTFVFNSNPSSNEGLKKSYNGIAYFIYEQHEEQHGTNTVGYFVTPKVFVILSEFPYYAKYYHLLIEISKMFKSNVEVPLEITLYNLIKYTPSPLTCSICINIPQYQNTSSSSTSSSSAASTTTTINTNELLFTQLTGLPIIDINLHKIFYHLGAVNVIKLFICSFLEKDIFIFSTNLELLSLVIYTFHTLNYPLNDGNYYWLNATVSYNDLITENSIFVSQSYPTMLGVHSPYNPAYLQRAALKSHFIMDLDNNVFDYNACKDKDQDDTRLVHTLLHFLKKVFKGSNSLQHIDLYIAVRCLYLELESLCNKKPIRATKFYEDITVSFSKTGEVVDYNAKVQEMFYKFMVKIVSMLYARISLHSVMDSKTNKNDRNRIEETFYNEFSRDGNEDMKTQEEKSFFEQLGYTFKFSSFVEGFIKSHNDNGLYQVPFIFLDEFANLMKYHMNKITSLSSSTATTETQVHRSRINDFNDMNFTAIIKDVYKRKYKNTKVIGSNAGYQLFRKSTNTKTGKIPFEKKNTAIISSTEFSEVLTASTMNNNDVAAITISFPTFELMHNADTTLMQRFHNEIYNIGTNTTIAVVYKEMPLLNIVQGSIVYPSTNTSNNSNTPRKSFNNHHHINSTNSSKSLSSYSDIKKGLYKYRQPYLTQKLLMKYIHYINDSDTRTKEQIMPWASFYLSNDVKDIRLSHIANEIEKAYINSNNIEVKDLIINNVVLLFTITIPLSQGSDLIETMFLFSEFLDMNVQTRKYFQDLLFVFEHLSHSNVSNEETTRSLKICVGVVLNKLRMKGLVSNSVLTKLINILNADKEHEGTFYDNMNESTEKQIHVELLNNVVYNEHEKREPPKFYTDLIQQNPQWEGVLENVQALPNKPSTQRETIPHIKTTFKTRGKGNEYTLKTYIYSPKTIFKDLSDLRDKLLYSVNKVNGSNFTIESLQYYCLCLLFYLRYSKMFDDCKNSVEAVLTRILFNLMDNKQGNNSVETA